MQLRTGYRLFTLFGMATGLSAATAAPLGPTVTYQGQLKQSGIPVNGSVSMEFRLYDAASAGNLIGTHTPPPVSVTSGLFTVQLNDTGQFGANAFNGDVRWLEIWVSGTLLTTRQQIAAAPMHMACASRWPRPSPAAATHSR